MKTFIDASNHRAEAERREESPDDAVRGWRPNDAVPANRRERPRREDRSEVQERGDRRGS